MENFKENVRKEVKLSKDDPRTMLDVAMELLRDDPRMMLTAMMVGYLVVKGAGRIIKEAVGKTPPNPNIPFEFVSMNDTEMTLGQNGENYTLKIDKLPSEIKDDLIKQNPNLESFLTNGPINIIDVKKQ